MSQGSVLPPLDTKKKTQEAGAVKKETTYHAQCVSVTLESRKSTKTDSLFISMMHALNVRGFLRRSTPEIVTCRGRRY